MNWFISKLISVKFEENSRKDILLNLSLPFFYKAKERIYRLSYKLINNWCLYYNFNYACEKVIFAFL